MFGHNFSNSCYHFSFYFIINSSEILLEYYGMLYNLLDSYIINL